MHNDVLACVSLLNEVIAKKLEKGATILNFKNEYEKLTMDIIGCCAFGIECNSLKSNHEFQNICYKNFQPTLLIFIKILVTVFNKNLLKKLQSPEYPNEVTKFFSTVVFNAIFHRRQTGQKRNDVLQILMELQNAYDDPKYANPLNNNNILGDGKFPSNNLLKVH